MFPTISSYSVGHLLDPSVDFRITISIFFPPLSPSPSPTTTALIPTSKKAFSPTIEPNFHVPKSLPEVFLISTPPASIHSHIGIFNFPRPSPPFMSLMHTTHFALHKTTLNAPAGNSLQPDYDFSCLPCMPLTFWSDPANADSDYVPFKISFHSPLPF